MPICYTHVGLVECLSGEDETRQSLLEASPHEKNIYVASWYEHNLTLHSFDSDGFRDRDG
jgi:hypothetical protein